MAAQPGWEQVYATLLLNDAYLPGALVLAHSLRDAGTTRRLAVLVVLESVSAEVITQLKTVYDIVIPVPRIRNERPANLYLMNRADLHSAFTKINLWKQTQFSKIVYIDADVVAYRAPDELFAVSAPFSAAPDIGWPDLFNSGVMVLTPNMGDYYALMAMADRGISFDGADQGLLNMHFRNNYNRLSFTYNVTPSAHYQYIPAYRHFQSSINMVHFIGPEKPWFQGRHASKGDSPFDEMFARWWAVYDKHYRVEESSSAPAQARAAPELVQYFVKGEFQPPAVSTRSTGEHTSVVHRAPGHEISHVQPPPSSAPVFSHDFSGYSSHEHPQQQHQHPHPHPHHHHQHEGHHEHHYHHDQSSAPSRDQHHAVQAHLGQHHHAHDHHPPAPGEGQWQHDEPPPPPPSLHSESFSHIPGAQAEAREEQVPQPEQRGAPSQPPREEQQREHPPAPLESQWDAQRHPPPSDARPEALNFPQQIYEMSQDTTPFVPPERYPSPPRNMWYEVPREPPASRAAPPKPIFPWEGHQPRPSRNFAGQPPLPTPFDSTSELDNSTAEQKSEPETPTTPTIKVVPSDPWTSFTRTNAWDEVPEIERYVEGLQKHRRGRSQVLSGVNLGGVRTPGGQEQHWGLHGTKLTDFPSEVERPSLPVTPAPIRRPKFWGGGGPGVGDDDDDPLLPAAEGVPAQTDWDPVAQLQKLAKQQSEALLKRLGGEEGTGVSAHLPTRALPFGSDGVTSPTYVAQSSGGVVLSPQPVKGSTTTSRVRSLGEEPGALPRTLGAHGDVVGGGEAPATIPAPAYGGPGAAWEKGEDSLLHDTPAPPTEEDRDILET